MAKDIIHEQQKIMKRGRLLEAEGLSFKNKVPYRIFLLEAFPKDQQDVHLLSVNGNMICEHIKHRRHLYNFQSFKKRKSIKDADA